MLSLASLKENRAVKADAIRAIIAKATSENRDLTDTEQGAFDAGKNEIEKVERDIRNAEYLADIERRVDGVPVANADGKFETECRKFSLLRAIASQIPGMNIDAGRELEISRELERRDGRSAQGILAPVSVFERRVVTTALPVGGPGSNIIATNLLAGEYIDTLREQMVVRRMGARVLNGLVGNVAIPRLKVGASGEWIAENDELSGGDVEFDQVSLTPKHVGALTEVSRNMIQQSSPDVESLLRDDFSQVIARAFDRVAILGGGANEPSGILATGSGVTDVPGGAAGLAPSWSNVLATIGEVLNANALSGSLGFVTNGKVTTKLCNVLKISTDTSSNFILESPGSNTLAGYPLGISNLVPSNLVKGGSGAVCSALIFGNWSDLLIGYWSSFDLLVNPYESTAYKKGNVMVRALATGDVTIRQPKSFAKLADILT